MSAASLAQPVSSLPRDALRQYPAMLVAGVDASTQTTKVLIVDVGDGRVLATGRAAHEVTEPVGLGGV